MYYYFINYLNIFNPTWEGTRMGFYKDLKNSRQSLPESEYYDCKKDYGKPNYFRFCRGTIVKNGGWHFSYLGGIKAIRNKIKSFSHQEFNSDEFCSETHISKYLLSGKDLFKRSNCRYVFSKIDKSYPSYIRNNITKFEDLIAPDPGILKKMQTPFLVLFLERGVFWEN